MNGLQNRLLSIWAEIDGNNDEVWCHRACTGHAR